MVCARSRFSKSSLCSSSFQGSYGSLPSPVAEAIKPYYALAEANPDLFHRFTSIDLIRDVRKRMAKFVGAAHTEEVVFVPNASHGLNTILRSFIWEEGDIISSCEAIFLFPFRIQHSYSEFEFGPQATRPINPSRERQNISPIFLHIPRPFSSPSFSQLHIPKSSKIGVHMLNLLTKSATNQLKN